MQVLERGERIELLVQSTDNLQTQAFSFKRDAGRLQRSMWWKNVRAQVMHVLLPKPSGMSGGSRPPDKSWLRSPLSYTPRCGLTQ